MEPAICGALEQRLGPERARRRLCIERDRDSGAAREGINPIGVPGFYVSDVMIQKLLRLVGLYRRGLRNALDLRVRHNFISEACIPQAFDGFTILHLSDLHTDANQSLVERLTSCLPQLRYDIAVLTGDYRGKSSGPFESALAGVKQIRIRLNEPVYGVLGDHDSIRMVPGLERMGIRMLLNESVSIIHGGAVMHVAGIDDAHRHHVDDIQQAASDIPTGRFSLLLSHTPEVYRQAAQAGFNLMLCGHTHGGQVCLPGGIAVTLDAVLPRRFGAGPWRYKSMVGYTSSGAGCSIVPVRFNCPPEITLHHLRALPS